VPAVMSTNDHADVAIKPPFLFLGALAIGCLLSLVVPIGPRLGSANGVALATGLAFIVIGFALAAWSVRVFHLAGTSVVPSETAATLVTSGPYKITRNPIYIGFILVYFGLSIVLTSLWILILLIPVLFILQRGVVEREEAYLDREFGEAYRKYKAKVPRWL
jgi:protein-S-isoprenylcysteine O-methyltransferase Ste14